jgi:hypothetical protein
MAVSRLPPSSSNPIVALTEGYTYAVIVWAVCLVQGPFPIAPCQTLYVTIRNFSIAVGRRAPGRRRPSRRWRRCPPRT